MKKILLFLMALAMSGSVSAQTVVLAGDMNRDGIITIADVTLLAKDLQQGRKSVYRFRSETTFTDGVSSRTFTKGEALVGDMNGDGNISKKDVSLLSDELLQDKAWKYVSDNAPLYIKDPQEYEWVDLGLPSGTLWATCNVGATAPGELGVSMAWGELTPKDSYTWGNYSFTNGGTSWDKSNLTKYCDYTYFGFNEFADNKNELEACDDAATMYCGKSWQMPSYSQMEELLDAKNTTIEMTTINGVLGYKFTGIKEGFTDKSIFMPLPDYDGEMTGDNEITLGTYWSRSLPPNFSSGAYVMVFTNKGENLQVIERIYSSYVRPVRVEKGERIHINTIDLSDHSLRMLLEDESTLSASIYPSNATDKSLSWSSSNNEVATVSEDGVVTAVGLGRAKITVKANDAGGVSVSCDVVVQETPSFTLSKTAHSMRVYELYKLKAFLTPSKSSTLQLTWTSSNPSVAYVFDDGYIYSLSEGKTTITATTDDDSGRSASCEITVASRYEPVDTREFVDLGLPSGTLWATCNIGAVSPDQPGDLFNWGETSPDPDDEYGWKCNWYCYGDATSANPNFGKYCGQSINGYEGYTDDLTQLEEIDDAAWANWGNDWQMPSGAQYEELFDSKYTTTERTIINNRNGLLVTSKMEGFTDKSIFFPATRDIKVTYYFYGRYWSNTLNPTDSKKVKGLSYTSTYTGFEDDRWREGSIRPVRAPILVSEIQLSNKYKVLTVGETLTLTATVLPEDATNKDITWTSSDESVATVSAEGVVTAVGVGTAKITVKATDGSNVSASCKVAVKRPDCKEYVDLGLPSGTLWATCNLGASTPEEFGDFYAWGETEPYYTEGHAYDNPCSNWREGKTNGYNEYSYFDFIQVNYGNNLKKYHLSTGGLRELEACDDAATVNWGSDWQIPTVAQTSELFNSDYINFESVYKDGVLVGKKFTSKIPGYTDKYIYIPFTGYRKNDIYYYNNLFPDTYFWTRSLYDHDKWTAQAGVFSEDICAMTVQGRYAGVIIRPVRAPILVSEIQLSKNYTILPVGENLTLTATVLPEDAKNKDLTWTSSEESVATVSADGVVTAVGVGTAMITVKATDGSNVSASCEVAVKKPDCKEYVDLGLPSRTLWATCNLGASAPEQPGVSLAWGEMTPKDSYTWGNYSFTNGGTSDNSPNLTKYCAQSNYGYEGFTDELTQLERIDDAARIYWGGDWQMPSDEQLKELLDSNNTTVETTKQGGRTGLKITSKVEGFTDKSIFLPALADIQSPFYTYHQGQYWSRTLDVSKSNCAMGVAFTPMGISYGIYRYVGCNIRPVLTPKLVSEIQLSKTQAGLLVGETLTLTATVLPENATNKGITWTSSDESVATVSADGVVTAVGVGTAMITVKATDGSNVSASCEVAVKKTDCKEYVDLGLPSGTLWATCNLGASTPEEFGDLYAWGETEPYYTEGHAYDNPCNDWREGKDGGYVIQNYFDYSGNDDGTGLKKYHNSTGGLKELEACDDAATVNWGSDWQIPSCDQLNELFNYQYTDCESVFKDNLFVGNKFTSKIPGYTDKSVFIPASGYRYSQLYSANISYPWVRSLDSDSWTANTGVICPYGYAMTSQCRYYANIVRPVRSKPISIIKLSESKTILRIGKNMTLTVSVTPDNPSFQGVNWSSSDVTVATVSAEGVVTAVGVGTAIITATAKDGGARPAVCEVKVKALNTDTKDYVDLGLPSGTLWATCNIGAKSPEEFGDYFAWGETDPYYTEGHALDNPCSDWREGKTKGYHEDSYFDYHWVKYFSYSYDGTPLNTELEAYDDAATANWGSDWQIPSYDQMNELITTCTCELVYKDEVYIGSKFIGKAEGYTDKFIFLPAAGQRHDSVYENGDIRSFYDPVDEVKPNKGFYWCRNLPKSDSSSAWNMNIGKGTPYWMEPRCRYYGYSVRPVRKK